jgi:hypothetical protein
MSAVRIRYSVTLENTAFGEHDPIGPVALICWNQYIPGASGVPVMTTGGGGILRRGLRNVQGSDAERADAASDPTTTSD